MEEGVSLPLVSVLPGDDIRLSVVSVPLTKEHVYLVGSNLLEFRPAGMLVGSSHSADLLGLDVQKWVSFFVPSRSKVGWPELVLPPLCTDLATTVLPALASSVFDVSSSSDIVIPKSWAPNPCLSHPDVHVQRLAGSSASGDCEYLSAGPHGGIQATLIKETADGIEQPEAFGFLGRIREDYVFGGPDPVDFIRPSGPTESVNLLAEYGTKGKSAVISGKDGTQMWKSTKSGVADPEVADLQISNLRVHHPFRKFVKVWIGLFIGIVDAAINDPTGLRVFSC